MPLRMESGPLTAARSRVIPSRRSSSLDFGSALSARIRYLAAPLARSMAAMSLLSIHTW